MSNYPSNTNALEPLSALDSSELGDTCSFLQIELGTRGKEVRILLPCPIFNRLGFEGGGQARFHPASLASECGRIVRRHLAWELVEGKHNELANWKDDCFSYFKTLKLEDSNGTTGAFISRRLPP